MVLPYINMDHVFSMLQPKVCCAWLCLGRPWSGVRRCDNNWNSWCEPLAKYLAALWSSHGVHWNNHSHGALLAWSQPKGLVHARDRSNCWHCLCSDLQVKPTDSCGIFASCSFFWALRCWTFACRRSKQIRQPISTNRISSYIIEIH